jgi:hypothetical protein
MSQNQPRRPCQCGHYVWMHGNDPESYCLRCWCSEYRVSEDDDRYVWIAYLICLLFGLYLVAQIVRVWI